MKDEPQPCLTMVLEISVPVDASPGEVAIMSRRIADLCQTQRGHQVFYQRVSAATDITQLEQALRAMGLRVNSVKRSPRL